MILRHIFINVAKLNDSVSETAFARFIFNDKIRHTMK